MKQMAEDVKGSDSGKGSDSKSQDPAKKKPNKHTKWLPNRLNYEAKIN